MSVQIGANAPSVVVSLGPPGCEKCGHPVQTGHGSGTVWVVRDVYKNNEFGELVEWKDWCKENADYAWTACPACLWSVIHPTTRNHNFFGRGLPSLGGRGMPLL